jgi:hypothetical protein
MAFGNMELSFEETCSFHLHCHIPENNAFNFVIHLINGAFILWTNPVTGVHILIYNYGNNCSTQKVAISYIREF